MVQFHLSGVPCNVQFSKLIVVSAYESDVTVSTRDVLKLTKILNSCAISFTCYFLITDASRMGQYSRVGINKNEFKRGGADVDRQVVGTNRQEFPVC